MVFLQGAARRGSPAGFCLTLVERGVVELCISPEILAEVADVLRRPSIRSKFPALTEEVVAEFVAALGIISTVFDNVPREFILQRDPKDESYLNLAYRAKAHYLVSRDTDLLDLAADPPAAGSIRDRYAELQILDPVGFINALRDKHVEEQLS
jgi:putative PIN family toxin of toxin-antitoxin system